MRGTEPKTQREIIASLGDLRVDERTSFLAKWRAKTLENRHVVLIVAALAFVFLMLSMLTTSRRSTGFAAGSSAAGGATVAYSGGAVHYSRDRPLSILVLRDVPPVEMDVQQWETLMNLWDSSFPMVVVLASDIPEHLLVRLDALLKRNGLVLANGAHRATWFVAAQVLPPQSSAVFYPTSPRMQFTHTFQSLVMGMQVELLTSDSLDNAQMLKRLSEGQGEVNTRLLIVPGALKAELLATVSRSAPLLVLSVGGSTEKVSVFQYKSSTLRTPDVYQSALTSKSMCVIRPFDVADWTWRCTSVASGSHE